MNPSGYFIEKIELTEEKVGNIVTYVPSHAKGDRSHKDCERGKIKSWNDGGVFVDYIKNVCRTSFSDLVWG